LNTWRLVMPRIRKGQTAPGIKKLSDAKSATVRARIRELVRLIRSNKIENEQLPPLSKKTNKCTKDLIASWNNENKGIFPISVNRLKKEHLSTIEYLINALNDKISKKSKNSQTSKKETISKWQRKSKEAEDTNQVLVDELVALREMYISSLNIMSMEGKVNKRTQQAIKRHVRKYGALHIAYSNPEKD